MAVPVLTAVVNPDVEADLVRALAREGAGLRVERRCVDLADLLAAATAGIGRVAVVSAELRRLDRDALTRLAVAGVGVVGIANVADDAGRDRLQRLGVARVISPDTPTAALAEALLAAVGRAGSAGLSLADPVARLPRPTPPADGQRSADDELGTGVVIAVWGPTGAPGRSTVAVGLAAELAAAGMSTLLVDSDVYGGSQAQLLGILDEAPGLAAACRLANSGSLDLAALAELAAEVVPSLRVLTGLTRADRWPELRPSGLEVVLALARSLARVTVVDCGFCLERDEELSFDTVAPRRNGATLTALTAADRIVAVGSGDPVGLQRFVRALADLADAVPGVTATTVINRTRASAVGGRQPRREIAAALERFAGITDAHYLPLDTASMDAALAAGKTLPEAAPSSPLRPVLQSLAAELTDLPPREPKRRSRRGRAKTQALT